MTFDLEHRSVTFLEYCNHSLLFQKEKKEGIIYVLVYSRNIYDH